MEKFIKINGINFKQLNKNTQRAMRMVRNYENSTEYSLRDAYKSYSYAKDIAQERILREMDELGGKGYRITGHCSNFFSCAYQLTNPIDGNLFLVYHTPNERLIIEL